MSETWNDTDGRLYRHLLENELKSGQSEERATAAASHSLNQRRNAPPSPTRLDASSMQQLRCQARDLGIYASSAMNENQLRLAIEKHQQKEGHPIMSIMRSDKQAALQEILVATQASADHIEDAAGFIDESLVSQQLSRVADERRKFADSIADLLRELGDLPTTPDLDRENVEHALRRLHAWLTPGGTSAEFLTQHAKAERKLLESVRENRSDELDRSYGELLDDLCRHIAESASQLDDYAAKLQPRSS